MGGADGARHQEVVLGDVEDDSVITEMAVVPQNRTICRLANSDSGHIAGDETVEIVEDGLGPILQEGVDEEQWNGDDQAGRGGENGRAPPRAAGLRGTQAIEPGLLGSGELGIRSQGLGAIFGALLAQLARALGSRGGSDVPDIGDGRARVAGRTGRACSPYDALGSGVVEGTG